MNKLSNHELSELRDKALCATGTCRVGWPPDDALRLVEEVQTLRAKIERLRQASIKCEHAKNCENEGQRCSMCWLEAYNQEFGENQCTV